MNRVIIIGGGAAGFFAAINAKEINPNLEITILEKASQVLQKVKISGGGRCNVTHACFDPKELVHFYPRGEKELLGPFHRFMTGDTFEWFVNRGIPLKIEADNRVFPESNSSQTIIDYFLNKSEELGIQVLKNNGVNAIEKRETSWLISTKLEQFECDSLVIAAGSSKQVWKLCSDLGHSIIEPVPSLFTFNIKDKRIDGLFGLSLPNTTVKLLGTSLVATGPLLITHWGLSGPAVLKLSAFGARTLAKMNYEYEVEVNWISRSSEEIFDQLNKVKTELASRQVRLSNPFEQIPKRLWQELVKASQIRQDQNWANLAKHELVELSKQLTKCQFQAKGKSTFKEEFVTSGGVDLKQINFKRFESKLHSNLFFIGEVLNIDAVTGGFNFQNAWTGGWICAQAIATN